MAKVKQLLETEKQEDNLSPYDRWQLERYGSIDSKANPEEECEFDQLTTAEINHIFNRENEAQ